jgi:hypothetical protein
VLVQIETLVEFFVGLTSVPNINVEEQSNTETSVTWRFIFKDNSFFTMRCFKNSKRVDIILSLNEHHDRFLHVIEFPYSMSTLVYKKGNDDHKHKCVGKLKYKHSLRRCHADLDKALALFLHNS